MTMDSMTSMLDLSEEARALLRDVLTDRRRSLAPLEDTHPTSAFEELVAGGYLKGRNEGGFARARWMPPWLSVAGYSGERCSTVTIASRNRHEEVHARLTGRVSLSRQESPLSIYDLRVKFPADVVDFEHSASHIASFEFAGMALQWDQFGHREYVGVVLRSWAHTAFSEVPDLQPHDCGVDECEAKKEGPYLPEYEDEDDIERFGIPAGTEVSIIIND